MTNIVTALNEGITKFTYTKADGSTRQATGTTNESLIPEASRSATNRNTDDSATISYFDTEKSAWRSFSRTALDTTSVRSEAAAG